MRLIFPEEVTEPVQGLVCRQSRLSTLLFTVLFLSLAIGGPTFLWWHVNVWPTVTLIALLFAALLAKGLLHNLWNTFRPTNWVLRISPDCLWINLRTYSNPDFQPAPVVVQLPYEEITSVSERTAQRVEHNRDGDIRWTDRALEIRLRQPAPDEVASEIVAERRRRVDGSALGGRITFHHRHGEQSVSLPETDLIRIAWRGRSNWVSPSLKRVLAELQGRVTVGEPTNRDFSKLDKLADDQTDQLVLELVKSGDKMGAIKLLTARRGYTLTDAHEFIEALDHRV